MSTLQQNNIEELAENYGPKYDHIKANTNLQNSVYKLMNSLTYTRCSKSSRPLSKFYKIMTESLKKDKNCSNLLILYSRDLGF